MTQDFTDRLAKAGTILTDRATIEALVAEVERLRSENAELRAQAAEWERLPELLQTEREAERERWRAENEQARKWAAAWKWIAKYHRYRWESWYESSMGWRKMYLNKCEKEP